MFLIISKIYLLLFRIHVKIDVRQEDKTLWLTLQQIAELYQTSRINVVEHIKHIYEEQELDENSASETKMAYKRTVP